MKTKYTKSFLEDKIASSKSFVDLYGKLGLSGRASHHSIRKAIKEYDIDTSHFSLKTKYTKSLLETKVLESKSMGELIDNLGLKRAGGNYSHIKKTIEEFNIDTSHFEKNKKAKKIPNKHTKETFMEVVLCENGAGWRSQGIKKKLIEFGFKKDVCEICGQSAIWNGKKLILQLDHIDGNHYNNSIENLRIVCPNCHSQTKTFCGRKNRHND